MWWNAETTRTLLALAALCLLIVQPAAGKRYWKYQDENGIWHYTDQKPAATRAVEEKRVKTEPQLPLEVEQHLQDNGFALSANIHLHGPVSLWISLEGSRNLKRPEAAWPLRLNGPGRVELWQLERQDADQPAQLNLAYRALPGWPMAQPEQEQLLQLPFPADRRFLVGQGFHGQSTHGTVQNEFAVDINMPEGTPVLAARDGVVMEVEENFWGHGQKEYYLDRANRVRLLHEDGSMTVYAHLGFEQVAVQPGQVVLVGELLGYSGNTGYSSGPHLHFAVQAIVNDELVSLPFRFITSDGDLLQPETGGWLPKKTPQLPLP